MEKARILLANNWGGNFTQQWLEDNQKTFISGSLVSEWNLTDLLPIGLYRPKWSSINWIEGLTPQEIYDLNKPIVPEEISAMDLKLQLFDLGITDNDIFLDIDSIPNSMFSVMEKEKAKIMYKTATRFQRLNGYVNLIATMEGLSQSQVDTIFINGNLR